MSHPTTTPAVMNVEYINPLVNIVTGQAKSQLEHLNLSVSLPTVICGKYHSIQFPTKVTPICIPFDSDWGPITVEVGLSEPRGNATNATDGR